MPQPLVESITEMNGFKNKIKYYDDGHSQKLNSNPDENMQAYGYERSRLKTYLIYISYVLTIGCLRVVFHWYPRFRLYATHTKCPLNRATTILIIDDYQSKYKSYFIKDVKVISLKNMSSEKLPSTSTPVKPEVINKVRDAELSLSLENGTRIEVPEYRAFWCKKQCYVWDPLRYEFSKLAGLDKQAYCTDLNAEKNNGLTREEQILRRIVYGNNEIILPAQSIMELTLLECLNPFYLSELIGLVVWSLMGYFYFCLSVVGMLAYSIWSTVKDTREYQEHLSKAMETAVFVRVLRSSGAFESVSSAELVPGDIIELPKNRGSVVCDAVLLSGTCVVNESVLTGESIPVTKTPLQPRPILYDSKKFAHHTLFCGTTIIQTKNYRKEPVLARVIRTGLQTTKGALVSSIMYPPVIDFEFEQDSHKMVAIIFIIAVFGLIYTIIVKNLIGWTNFAYLEALSIFATGFPPALPAIMLVGTCYSYFRLRDKGILCTNARILNVSGSINCVCFDKTGTLTEEGLDLMGVAPNENKKLGELEKSVKKLKKFRIFEGMLVCHSLVFVDDELIGDPLDIKMFESTGWSLLEPDLEDSVSREFQTARIVRSPLSSISHRNSEIIILQQFQFSSELRRMSVITRVRDSEEFKVYVKGSPEMILSLSKPESYPQDVEIELRKYTEQGYRVIGVGCSNIKSNNGLQVQSMQREMIEKDLEFLGLLIFKNKLKTPTATVIGELREAKIKTIMVTGDNIETAVSVAKECGIISSKDAVVNVTVVLENNVDSPDLFFNVEDIHSKQSKKFVTTTIPSIKYQLRSNDYKFVLTGNAWQLLRNHYSELLPKICVKGAVFARMTSEQKKQLVIELTQLGYYVAMCGDGANDCGALRSAHIGISLSDAEASVASSFTSTIPDITCVPTVIQEGRAALVTSYGLFQYFVVLTLLEFFTTVILYAISSNFTDFQFLILDVCLCLNFEIFYGDTDPYDGKLAPEPPAISIMSLAPLFSFVTHTLIAGGFQVYAMYAVRMQEWYVPHVKEGPKDYTSYENYSVFCLCAFQYITIAILYARGKPYRMAIYTNQLLMIGMGAAIILCLYFTLYPANWVIDLLELELPPTLNWRFTIVVLAVLNFIISFFIEEILVQRVIERRMRSKKFKDPKKLYLRLERELESEDSWTINNIENHMGSIIEIEENGVTTNKKNNIINPRFPISYNYQKLLNNEVKKDNGDTDSVVIFENSAFVGND